MRWGLVVGVALAASVTANVYLLLAGPEPQQLGRRKQAPPRPTKPVEQPAADPAAVPDEIAKAERSQLEKRLAAAEAKLEKVTPIHVKFERGEPDPDSEARLQPVLDKIFNEGSEYTLECRDLVCKITAPRATEKWRDAMQSAPELVGMFDGAMFGRDVFVRLQDATRAASIRTVTAPIYALLVSPALAACKRDNPAQGTLWLSIQVTAGKFASRANGPLADQAIGVCIRRALEDIAAKTPIPPAVTTTEEVPFPVPLP